MSCRKISIIVGFLVLIPLLLAVTHRHVFASSSADIEDNGLINKERNSQKDQAAKSLKPKRIIIMSVPTSQKSLNRPEERIENRISKKGFQWSRSCLEEKKTFRDREEAEEYMDCLLEEREVLEGDFFGINTTAYRYVNVFYRRGYIRSKIFEIDKEIKRTKSALLEIEK